MAEPETIVIPRSLKEHVYDYLQQQLSQGRIQPGAMVNLDATSRKLGISKTPLREALIMLEVEGFVTIAPRRGVYVNALTVKDIREFYPIIGALEFLAMSASAEHMGPDDIERLDLLNQAMRLALQEGNLEKYQARDLDFHNVFLDLSGNRTLVKIVTNLKKRLVDYARRDLSVKDWEESSIGEHQQIIELVRVGQFPSAADHLREVHWSLKVQEQFFNKYYPQGVLQRPLGTATPTRWFPAV